MQEQLHDVLVTQVHDFAIIIILFFKTFIPHFV